MTIYDNILYNLNEADIDKPIYRIMTIERLSELFNKGQLIFPQVKVWEDVYENFFLKSVFIDSNDEIIDFEGDTEEYYGQCWSLTKDSDALWRIYSPDKKNIRVKTTIRKIADLLNHESFFEIGDHKGFCFDDKMVGKVEYESYDKINKKIQDDICMSYNYNILPFIKTSLFLKRKEFKHENEIRIIYLVDEDDSRLIDGKKLVALDINPLEFIEEIAFDPRIEDSVFEILKKGIIQKYNDFPESKIIKSKLYQFSPFVFKLEKRK